MTPSIGLLKGVTHIDRSLARWLTGGVSPGHLRFAGVIPAGRSEMGDGSEGKTVARIEGSCPPSERETLRARPGCWLCGWTGAAGVKGHFWGDSI